MLRPIDQGCTSTEKVFNFLGGVPVVGVVSGAVRVVAGKIQLIAATSFATFGVFASILCSNPADRTRWNARTDHAVDHMCHGILNMARGTFEAVIGVSMIGSLLLLISQKQSTNGFEPIVKYGNHNQRYVAVID